MSDPDETRNWSCHVGCTPESGSKIRGIGVAPNEPQRVGNVPRRVIQGPKLGTRIMRYELTDDEWATLEEEHSLTSLSLKKQVRTNAPPLRQLLPKRSQINPPVRLRHFRGTGQISVSSLPDCI